MEQLTILAGLSLVPVVVVVAWMMILQRGLKSGRRVRLKLRDLSPIRKLYVVGLVGYFGFDLYSELTTIIPLVTGTGPPFLTELQDVVTVLWLGTLGVLGVGFLYAVRSPVRKATPER